MGSGVGTLESRWAGGGGERGDPALGVHTVRGHQGREDAAGPGHPEAPLLWLRHLPRARGRRRRHGQHGRRRALRPGPHRQLRLPRAHQGWRARMGRPAQSVSLPS